MGVLAILGASGHGKVIADAAACSGSWSDIFFFDDVWPECQRNGAWEVRGGTEDMLNALNSFDGVFVAIGDNAIRHQKLKLLSEHKARLVTVIHPDASVSPHASIGEGSAVFAQSVVQVGAQLDVGCIVNTGATVDHDCTLGACVHVSPGVHLAGGVRVGQHSWIGIGASVRQQIELGCAVVVGAGATVVKPVADGMTVVGTPAKILKKT